jgi:hypothetical protein
MEETIMRRRLYFILPDVASARRVADELLLARIEDRHMHFLAQRGTDLGELHEASYLQKTDLVHGAEVGLAIGGCGGFLLGIFVFLAPPEGVTLQLVTVLITTLAAAFLGAWIASLAGTAVPNSRLKLYQDDIAHGKVLLMLDLPVGRVEEVRALISRHHPEASAGRLEPASPAFP